MISLGLAAVFTGLVSVIHAAPLEPRAGYYYFFNTTTKALNGNSTFGGKHLSLRYAEPKDHSFGYVVSITNNKTDAALFQQAGAGDEITVEKHEADQLLYLGLPESQPFYQGNDTAIFPSAPTGYYNVIASSNTSATAGFQIENENKAYVKGTLGYNGIVTNFGAFAVCEIRREDGSDNYFPRFLWRASDAEPDTSGQCADVQVNIKFEE